MGQLVTYAAFGHMVFSSSFVLEFVSYIAFGVLHIWFAWHIGGREYLPVAIAAVVVGTILFVLVGFKLFLTFEFGNDLSI